MTRDEFRTAAFLLGGGWPGQFTANDEDAYYFLLSDFDVADVMRALKALRHAKFRPSASEIANVLTPEKSAVPTFDEMFTLLFSPRGALAASGVDGTRARLAGLHPLVSSFAERQGVQRLKELPVHDADDGHWRRKELLVAWDGHVEAMEGREVAMVASGGSDLRRLDPMAVVSRLTAGPPELGDGS
jgi:hypothetical protein